MPHVHARSLPLLWLALGCLVSACSSTQVYATHDPSADFRNYTTYGFVPQLGTDDPQYGSLLSEFLKQAAARELEARGYRAAEKPDLLVNFYVRTQDRIRSHRSPSSFYGFRQLGFWNYGVWGGYVGYETTVTQYTEGTLHIDVVDRVLRQVVWEAAVVGRLTQGDLAQPQEFADHRVALAFAEYPFAAGQSAAAQEED